MSRVVARGSIRVDARRATEKLREHLLVDLHLYALEIVRAAIAGGATRVDVEFDADDLSLTFDGELLPPATLARLLDHVLEEASTRDARRKRLLALGVNAALGLRPAFVDLTSVGDVATRVRWTPELLEEERLPTPERVPSPPGARPGTTRVHVRRRLGLDVLLGALARIVPPEIELLGAAAFALPVPLTLHGEPFPLPPRPPALVRVPFEVRGASRAALEIVAAPSHAPSIDLLELGVRLLASPLSFGAAFPSDPGHGVELPVRLFVDAEELPTNASRSALREDAPLRRLVFEAAIPALRDAIAGLAAAVTGAGEAPPGVEILSSDASALEDALGAIACVVSAASPSSLPAEARAVLDLPLLHDATGRRIAPSALRGAPGARLFLWRGDVPVDDALRPWLRDVVWIRGRLVERTLRSFDVADAAGLVAQARAGAERRRRFLERAASAPALPAFASGAIRAPFHVEEGALAGLRGEVAITPGAIGPRRVHAFVEGRAIETIELDPTLVPLPIEAAIAWENRLIPRYSFDGVERNAELSRAISYAVKVAVFAADRELDRLARAGDSAAALDALRPALRAAIGALLVTDGRLGLDRAEAGPVIQAFKALHAARVWPTTEPGRWESVASLAPIASQQLGICVAKPGPHRRAADARPVIAADPHEIEWLAAALGGVEIVPYDHALLDRALPAAERDLRRAKALAAAIRGEVAVHGGPVMPFVREGVRAVITPSPSASAVLLHGGAVCASGALPATLGPIAIAIDDDAHVPTRAATGLASQRVELLFAAIERDFRDCLVAALEGSSGARARLDGEVPADPAEATPAIRAYLLDRAAARPAAEGPAARALTERIEALPLLAILDENGAPTRASLASVRAARPPPDAIPMLAELPGFETLAWRPLLVPDAADRAAIERWSEGRARRAEHEIPIHFARAQQEYARRAFLAGPVHDARALGDLADAGARALFLDAEPGVSVSVAVALPRASIPIDAAWIDVLFQGRALCRRALPMVALPLVARVGLSDELHLVDFRDLSPPGLDAVAARVRSAAAALALDLLQRARGPGNGRIFFGDARALRLVAALVLEGGAERGASEIDRMLAMIKGDALRDRSASTVSAIKAALEDESLLFPTVQGAEQPLSALRAGSAELVAGAALHVPWRAARPTERASDLDRPILHLPATPEGALLQAILAGIGLRARHVTEAIARLQERRAGRGPAAPPALAGAPAHPALRVGLASLGIDAAEGEVEIIEGPASEIRVIDLSGAARDVDASLPVPLRALLRVDGDGASRELSRALLTKITRAIGAHLVTLVPRLDELPAFARAHLRGVVCSAIGKRRKVARRVASAPLFEDLAGALHSLDELRAGPAAPWGFTSDPPPYAERAASLPIIRLDARCAGGLARAFRLDDRTAELRVDLAGERRARAPQIAAALDPALRACCVHVISVTADGVTGEVGLLAPEHEKRRGVEVLSDRRPLFRLDDRPGWAVAAVVDVTAPPNRAFDGFAADAADAASAAVRAAVRAAADRALREWAAPPADALAVRAIYGPDGDGARIRYSGVVWLPAVWPATPQVRARIPNRELSRPLVSSPPNVHIDGTAPVEGRILATADGPWHLVGGAALSAAAALVLLVRRATPDHASLPEYQWNMRLLGRFEGGPILAPSADRGSVGPDQVRDELAARGCLWVTSRRGDADGAFPDSPPAFVLLEGSALVRVLRLRGAPNLLRELGGLSSADSHSRLQSQPQSQSPSQTISQFLSQTPLLLDFPEPAQSRIIEDPPPQSPSPQASSNPPPSVDSEPAPSGLQGFFRAVGSLLGRAPEPPPAATALARAVERALFELAVHDNPVIEVLESRSGRPVRYEPSRRRVLLNPTHPALSWLGPASEDDARAVAILAAAAVSEVNRALVAVTEADECHALDTLLGRLAATTTASH